MARVHEQGPVMVLAFQAQQLTRKMAKGGSVEDVSRDHHMHVVMGNNVTVFLQS